MKMALPTPSPDWQTALHPWRLLAAVLAAVQRVGLTAMFVVVFLASRGFMVAGYVIAGVIVLVEIAQWAFARAALTRVRTFDPHQLYSSLPLEAAHQRIVEFGLALSVIAPVYLVLEIPTPSFKHEKLVALFLLLAAFAPSYLALARVRRDHSWLAMSRIPAFPRERRSQPAAPRYKLTVTRFVVCSPAVNVVVLFWAFADKTAIAWTVAVAVNIVLFAILVWLARREKRIR
jgi:hypothetical protein